MPCACQGNQSQSIVYDFVDAAGVKKEYTSEIQARAAVIRAGGGQVVKRVK